MIEREILQALQGAVTAAVAASTLPALPIAYVDITFTPPSDQKYLEIVFLPNNQMNGFWGNSKNYMGAMRLILHWRNDGSGPYTPMNTLASICAYFTKDRFLSAVKIADEPDFTGSIAGQGDLLYPATVRYSRFN